MHYVYVLHNLKLKHYYFGCTDNLEKRLIEHQNGENISTKSNCEYWRLIFYEAYLSKKDALIRERQFKRHSSASIFLKKRLINSLIELGMKG